VNFSLKKYEKDVSRQNDEEGVERNQNLKNYKKLIFGSDFHLITFNNLMIYSSNFELLSITRAIRVTKIIIDFATFQVLIPPFRTFHGKYVVGLTTCRIMINDYIFIHHEDGYCVLNIEKRNEKSNKRCSSDG
jgi:hypothetical protein